MLVYNYFEIDMLESAHGRAPPWPPASSGSGRQNLVFSYQGDGDLAAIGTAERFCTPPTAARTSPSSSSTTAIYGMTGGQMAPTTLLDQVTTTTPTGRDAVLAGHPVRICEVFAQLDGTSYLERVAVNKPAAVVKAKKAIKKAFQRQVDGAGFSLVEIPPPAR